MRSPLTRRSSWLRAARSGGLGRPMQTPRTLDLSQLSGIRDYEPSELVLTAGAATPLAEIEEALAPNRQMLAFEPPDWRSLLGTLETRPLSAARLPAI